MLRFVRGVLVYTNNYLVKSSVGFSNDVSEALLFLSHFDELRKRTRLVYMDSDSHRSSAQPHFSLKRGAGRARATCDFR